MQILSHFNIVHLDKVCYWPSCSVLGHYHKMQHETWTCFPGVDSYLGLVAEEILDGGKGSITVICNLIKWKGRQSEAGGGEFHPSFPQLSPSLAEVPPGSGNTPMHIPHQLLKVVKMTRSARLQSPGSGTS